MKSSNSFQKLGILFFSLITLSTLANSQPLGTLDKGVQQIQVVTINFYRAYEYSPAKRLSLDTSTDAIEKTLALHFDAMRSGAISNFLDLWEANSRQEIDRLQQRETPDIIFKRWKSVLDGRDVEIINRYKYKNFDLIEYQLVDRVTKVPKFGDLMVLANVGQSTKLTLELKTDPVIRAIRERKKRVEDVAGPIPTK